jgi:hypothetical protein
MPDITMCPGDGCQKQHMCYRHTAKASDYQSYFMTPPMKEDGECDYFMEIWDKPKELMRIKNGQVYIDGELVPEEDIKEMFKHILNQEDDNKNQV